jgi:hypothetical protein
MGFLDILHLKDVITNPHQQIFIYFAFCQILFIFSMDALETHKGPPHIFNF